MMPGSSSHARAFRIVAAGAAWMGAVTVPLPVRAPAGHEPGPRLRWQVAGSGIATPIANESRVFFLSQTHEVVAIDRQTGVVVWRRPTKDEGNLTPGSRLALTGSLVIAGDYNVTTYEASTGDIAWRFVPEVGLAPGLFLGDVHDGVVTAGSASGMVYAIDAASGALLWSRRVVPSMDATVYSPRVSGDVAIVSYVAFTRLMTGGVAAFDLRTGRQLWHRTTFASASSGPANTPSSPPVIAGAVVIVPNRDGVIYALDTRSGRIRWHAPAATPALGRDGFRQDHRALATTMGTLIAGSLTGMVTAYDVRNGRQRWSTTPMGASAGFVVGAQGETAFVPFLSGDLLALDLRTGRERWRLGGAAVGIVRPPLLIGNQLYMSGATGGYLSYALP